MKRAALLFVAFALVACGGKKEGASSGGAGASAAGGGGAAGGAQAEGPKGGGSITGTISFTGAAPANPTIDMSQETACKGKYTSAPIDSEYAVSNGKLANVFIYVKSGLPAGATYPAPSTSVEIDQNGCLYHPRVLGLMVGQKLEIKNSDPVLHNIKAVPSKNRGFNISQPSAGMKTTRNFTEAEVMVPLQCNVHGWMHAYAGVLPHPFFAVSGGDGTFKITGLPAGTYTIEAWHEKLGTKTMSVTVGANEAKTADFSFAKS